MTLALGLVLAVMIELAGPGRLDKGRVAANEGERFEHCDGQLRPGVRDPMYEMLEAAREKGALTGGEHILAELAKAKVLIGAR